MATPSDATPSGTPKEPSRAAASSQPASADLAALVHEEIEAKPTGPAAGFLQADAPALASAPAWQPTDTFWQKMTKRSSRRLKPVHLIAGGLAAAVVAGVVAVVLVMHRHPAPKGEGSAPVATAAPAAGQGPTTPAIGQAAVPPKAASTDSTPPSSAQSDAETAPAAKGGGAKAKARSGDERKKAAPKEKVKGAGDEPAETPVQAAPAAGRALTADDIKAGVKQGTPAVTGCIKAARAKGELLPGTHTLTLDWVIAPSGAVTDANLRGPAAVLSTSLPACFSQGMRQWRFPTSPAGAPVKNFPFGPFTLK